MTSDDGGGGGGFSLLMLAVLMAEEGPKCHLCSLVFLVVLKEAGIGSKCTATHTEA